MRQRQHGRAVPPPSRRLVGFAAAVALSDVDGALEEVDRAVGELGALGVQIHTNILGSPLDEPCFEPFFAKLAGLGRTVWVHPVRTPLMPDYPGEPASRYGMWMAFGWPYETTVFMCRMVLAGAFQRHPDLRILTHHAGGMIPHFAERIGKGLDFSEPMGYFVAFTSGQQRWIRTLGIGHKELLADTDAGLAPQVAAGQ
jgi:predicted TIM-barrel fold metal-dependent hydrolase